MYLNKTGTVIRTTQNSTPTDIDNQQLNIRINNVNYYNEDVPTRELYKEVNDCMLSPLTVNMSQFTNGCADLFTSENLFNAAQNTGLRGNANISISVSKKSMELLVM